MPLASFAQIAGDDVPPVAFFTAVRALFDQAHRENRGYLSWPEWEAFEAAARAHGLFDAVIDGDEILEPRYGDFSFGVVHAVKAYRAARAAGMSPWQFSRHETARIDKARIAERAAHEEELRRKAALKRGRDQARGDV